jgi:hypothetical protein
LTKRHGRWVAVTASLLTPVPRTSSGRITFAALLINLIAPPVHPVTVGVKLTFSSTLCPASKTSGRLKEDAVNSELLAVILEMVALVCPLLVKATGKVSV